MGYRLYFYIVPKDIIVGIQQAETLRHAMMVAHPERNCDTNDEDEMYLSVYDIDQSYSGFEFGKSLDADHMDYVVGDSVDLKWFADGDHDAHVGGVDMVKRAIEWDRDRIVENYRIESEDDEKAIESAKGRYTWGKQWLVNLDLDKRELTTSWLYEHQIFNLVSLYKNTDWDKYGVIFAGW